MLTKRKGSKCEWLEDKVQIQIHAIRPCPKIGDTK